ncbi:ABC transporter family substrate-binding protein, partial [Streptomyces sp. TRM76130]|nr:ABC transporter family substrate-binding protein [Streptomyces sp. TRM76130]
GEGEGEEAAGAEPGEGTSSESDSPGGDDGTYIVGQDGKGEADGDGEADGAGDGGEGDGENKANGSAPGAYAPKGTAAPAGPAAAPLARNGKPLTLRFVLPSGPGSGTLRTVAGRIASMLDRIGIRTDISKVPDESYFRDHIANGDYDLALYSWPATAFPATDARPIYAKPVPAADGSLNVEQ